RLRVPRSSLSSAPPCRRPAYRASICVMTISLDELQLAARNHGMPLELLREPITPRGLHYLLIHFDVPDVDAAAWRLELDGLVRTPLSLTLDELRACPARTVPATAARSWPSTARASRGCATRSAPPSGRGRRLPRCSRKPDWKTQRASSSS